jgi:hypothetical protein
MGKKSPLTLVPGLPATGIQPPRPLGEYGRALWDRVTSEYDIADSAGVETLCAGCQALDRAETLRAEIEHDGPVLKARGLIKDHPALKHELANRAFVIKALQRLGLNFEPLRPSAGRPGKWWPVGTKRQLKNRRAKARITAEVIELFTKLEAVPARRRKSQAFRDGERKLARSLDLVDAWWSGNSVLSRSRESCHPPEYMAHQDWHRCHEVRMALLAAAGLAGAKRRVM